MNSTVFDQSDHPLIICFQAIVAFTMFRLFFLVRQRPAPMPQIVALLAFAILFNLEARIRSEPWFFIANIVMYGAWALVTSVWALSVSRQKRAAATGAGDAHGKSAIVSVNLFDRYENRISWGVGLLIAGLVLYGYIDNYTDRIETLFRMATAEQKGYAKAVAEGRHREVLAKQSRDSIAAALKEKDIKDSLWRAFIAKDRSQQLSAIRDVRNEMKRGRKIAPPRNSPAPLIITQPAPKSTLLPAPATIPTERVKTLPMPRKGRNKLGYDDEMEEDTNVVVKRY